MTKGREIRYWTKEDRKLIITFYLLVMGGIAVGLFCGYLVWGI